MVQHPCRSRALQSAQAVQELEQSPPLANHNHNSQGANPSRSFY